MEKSTTREIKPVNFKYDEKAFEGYATGLVTNVAIPFVILAALSLFLSYFFCFCRCCLNGCGGKNPRDGGYSPGEYRRSLGISLLIIGCLATAAIVGMVGNSSVGSVTEKVQHEVVDEFFPNFNEFLDVAVELPKRLVNTVMQNSDNALKSGMNKTESLAKKAKNITSRFDKLLSDCRTVGRVDAQTNTFCDQMEANRSNINVDAVVSMSSTIDDALKSQTKKISSKALKNIDVQLKEFEKTRVQIRKFQTEISKGFVTAQSVEDIRFLATTATFALSLAIIVLVIFGAFCKIHFPLRLAAFLSVVAMVLYFVLCGAHLILAGGMSDTCLFVDDIDRDFEAKFGVFGSIAHNCITSETGSLTDVIDVTPLLPKSEDVSKELDKIVNSGDISTDFKLTPLRKQIANISDDGIPLVAKFKKDMESLVVDIESLSSDFKTTVAEFKELASLLVGQIHSDTKKAAGNVNCGFVGDLYVDVKSLACNKAISGLEMVVFAYGFSACLFALVFILSIKLDKRVGNVVKGV